MIDPARITIPMNPIVFPNPELTECTTSSNDKVPDNPPYPKAAIKSEKTGCHLNFEVVKTINPTAMNNKTISHMIER
jgi:hypothetical protein